MNSLRKITSFGVSLLLAGVSLAACSNSNSYDDAINEMLASVEEKIPTRDRLSVRICEEMFNRTQAIQSFEEAMQLATNYGQALAESDDPNGMRNALIEAWLAVGDASFLADEAAYNAAGMNLATVCTDIVSGEYGK